MQKTSRKDQWYSYPLLINPNISKYSGAYAGKVVNGRISDEEPKMRKNKQNFDFNVAWDIGYLYLKIKIRVSLNEYNEGNLT